MYKTKSKNVFFIFLILKKTTVPNSAKPTYTLLLWALFKSFFLKKKTNNYLYLVFVNDKKNNVNDKRTVIFHPAVSPSWE